MQVTSSASEPPSTPFGSHGTATGARAVPGVRAGYTPHRNGWRGKGAHSAAASCACILRGWGKAGRGGIVRHRGTLSHPPATGPGGRSLGASPEDVLRRRSPLRSRPLGTPMLTPVNPSPWLVDQPREGRLGHTAEFLFGTGAQQLG